MNTESRVENVNTWIVLAAILALTMAVGTVTIIYAYMDHTNAIVSLRAGRHDMRCLHEQCWVTEHAK